MMRNSILEYDDWGIELRTGGKYKINGVKHKHTGGWCYTTRAEGPRHCAGCGAKPPKEIQIIVCLIEPALLWWY